MKITKKSITLLLAGLLCASNSFSQTYPKQDGVIRLLTYNTHYCKGGTDPGSLNDLNTKRFANILKALECRCRRPARIGQRSQRSLEKGALRRHRQMERARLCTSIRHSCRLRWRQCGQRNTGETLVAYQKNKKDEIE